MRRNSISSIYVYSFFLIPLLLVVSVFSVSFWIEPDSGDLARMGGYSENLYGWEIAQKKFSEPLYTKDKYDKYYDVVVFGDSFTYKNPGEQTTPGSYWQNFLINETGLSVIVLDLNRTNLDEILNSSVYKMTPPKIFIYENIERTLIHVPLYVGLNHVNATCDEKASPVIRASYISPLGLTPTQYKRNKNLLSAAFWEENDEKQNIISKKVVQASNFIKKRVLQDFFGLNLGNAYRLELRNDKLFSSQKSDSLLVYKKDFLKEKWSKDNISAVRCQLLLLQSKVQENAKTFFIFMGVPDKLTAYQDIIKMDEYKKISKLDDFDMLGFHFLSLAEPIHKAVKSGADIYFPNDTHWGSVAHELASEHLISYLIGKKLLIYK